MSQIPTILQLAHIDETGDSYYRMRWPAQSLALQKPWRVLNLQSGAAERYEWAKEAEILVLVQSADRDFIPIMRERRSAGKKTFVEYNDNFYAAPLWSPVAKEWSDPKIWGIYEKLMDESDGVFVTGPGLFELLKQRTPEAKIHILKNHLPSPPPTWEKLQSRKPGEITIGWAGSLGHMADLLAILPLLTTIIRESPNTKLAIMGNESIREFVGLPKEKFLFAPWGTMEQYFKFWEGVHIGVAPLLDTAYNRCRSDIKAVEMASRGVLPVLPPFVPYRDFIKEAAAPVYSDFERLGPVLRGLLANFSEIQTAAKKVYQYVVDQRLFRFDTLRADLLESSLPHTLSSFSWPVGAGYHELNGSPTLPSPSDTTLMAAKTFTTKGDLKGAYELLSAKSGIGNADIALSALRCLSFLDINSALEKIPPAVSEFPRDIRFLLLKASISNAQDLVKLWSEVIDFLTKLPPHAVPSHKASVTQSFIEALKKQPNLLQFGETMVSLFPHAPLLRFALAENLRAVTKDAEALVHYKVLLQQYELACLDPKFAQAASLGYLSAWVEALAARPKSAGSSA